MGKLCPHCREEITSLQYLEDATIYGTFDIETEDYEQDETEADGNLRFRCPECDEAINSVEDLIDSEEDQTCRTNEQILTDYRTSQENNRPDDNNGEEGRDLPVLPAIDHDWRGEYSGYHNSHDTQKPTEIIVCPKCKCKTEAIIGETVECYNCNKEFNNSNAKKIIKIDNI